MTLKNMPRISAQNMPRMRISQVAQETLVNVITPATVSLATLCRARIKAASRIAPYAYYMYLVEKPISENALNEVRGYGSSANDVPHENCEPR